MKGKLHIYYDDEGDFLEISVGTPTQCISKEIDSGVFIRYDKKTREAKSVGILNFKQRAKSITDIILNLPIKVNFEVE